MNKILNFLKIKKEDKNLLIVSIIFVFILHAFTTLSSLYIVLLNDYVMYGFVYMLVGLIGHLTGMLIHFLMGFYILKLIFVLKKKINCK